MIGSALGALGLGIVALQRSGSGSRPAWADGESAGPSVVLGPGVAGDAPAERWALDTALAFPVASHGGLHVLNNFNGYSTSFGSCGHKGIDIFRTDAKPGQPLLACVDGVLVGQRLVNPDNDNDPPMGNAWILQGSDGTAYRYHHLQSFAAGLVVGSRVRRGQVIGAMGSTGNPSDGGPHLHFEVRRGGHSGTPVNPVPLLPFPDDGSITLGPSSACR